MTENWLILPVESEQLRSALWNGFLEVDGRRLRAVPLEMIREGEGRKAILHLKPLLPVNQSFVIRWWHGLRVNRALWVLLTAAWVYLLGMGQKWSFYPGAGFLAIFGALFVHLAINALAEIQDTLRLLDFSRWYGPGSEFSAIHEGWITPRTLWTVFWGLLGVAIACGVPLMIWNWEALLPMVAMGLVACWGYTQPPLSLKYRGWGELVLFLACGPALVLGLSWCFFEQWNFSLVCVGSCVGLWMVALHHIGNLPDGDRDRENGVQTLVTWMGFLKARWFVPLFYFLAWLSVIPAVGVSDLSPVLILGLGALLFPQILLGARILRASGSASVWMAGVRRRAQWVHVVSLLVAVIWTGLTIWIFGGLV